MPLLPTNPYFTSPLIGTDVRADGINPTEILNYLFKKSFGIPNAQAYYTYNTDFANDYKSTPSVKNDKIYSQKIPNSINKPRLINNISLDPTEDNFTEDTNWINIGYTNTYNYTLGQKYISKIYPYLVYYNDVKMITTGYNTTPPPVAPSFIVGNSLASPVICLSTNIIPYYYGNGTSYNITLSDDTISRTPLFFGDEGSGSWIMDTDSGVLTFYNDVTSTTINNTNPPRISYWRYEGLTGNANIVEVFDA